MVHGKTSTLRSVLRSAADDRRPDSSKNEQFLTFTANNRDDAARSRVVSSEPPERGTDAWSKGCPHDR